MIGAQTRRSIFDTLRVERVSWSGELDDVAFLQRLYDLTSMISYDGRFKDAANDIWQHRVNNPFDWADDWIYDDARFNLMDSPDDALLRFLCEMLHPVVRTDAEEVERLLVSSTKRFDQKVGRSLEYQRSRGGLSTVPPSCWSRMHR